MIEELDGREIAEAPPRVIPVTTVAARPRGLKAGGGTWAAAHTLLTRLVQQGVNAATGIITARALLPEGRGQLAAMILWSLFLAGLTTFGLPAALVYFNNRLPARRAELISSGLTMSLLAGFVTMVVGIYFMPAWLHQYPGWLILGARWFLILTPVCSISIVSRAVLEANGQFAKSNLQQLFVPALTLLLLSVAGSMHLLTVMSAALCYTIPAVPAFAIALVQVRPLLRGWQPPSLWGSRTLLTYGLRCWGGDLLGTIGGQVDQVLVIRLLTPADMGTYAVMLSLSRVLGIIQSSVVTVLFPKTASLGKEEMMRLIGRAARVSSAVTLVAGIAVAGAGPGLLKLLYGKEYIHSLGTFRVLLLEMVIGGATGILSQAFMSMGRPGLMTILQAVGLALSVPAMLWLIPKWGLAGAAAALLFSTMARFALLHVAFSRVLKTKPPDLLLKLDDIRYVITVMHDRFAFSARAQ